MKGFAVLNMDTMVKKTILLTGSTGFLGSQLLNILLSFEHKVIILIRKNSNLRRIQDLVVKLDGIFLAEENGIAKAFIEHKVDTVIHCATNYGRNQSDSLEIVQANLILPLTLLNIGKKNGLKYFFNTDTLLDKRISDYSLSKRHFNDWLQQSSDCLVAVNLALEHFYGAGDDTSKFVSWLVNSILKNGPSISLTAGNQKRDFIHISDTLDAILKIINWSSSEKNGYYPFEIGTGITTSIKDLAMQLAMLADYDVAKLNFGAIPFRVNEVMESKVNLTRLNELDWTPKIILSEGLKMLVAEEKKIRSLQ